MHKAESTYEEAKATKHSAKMAYRAAKAAFSATEKACWEAQEAYGRVAAAYDEDLDSLFDVDQAAVKFEGSKVDHTNSFDLQRGDEEIDEISTEAARGAQKIIRYSNDQTPDFRPNSPADTKEIVRDRQKGKQKKRDKKAFKRADKKPGTVRTEPKNAATVVVGDRSQTLAAQVVKDACQTEEDKSKPTKSEKQKQKQKQKRARTEASQQWLPGSSYTANDDIDSGYGCDPWAGWEGRWEGPELSLGDPRDREVAEIMGMNPYAMDWS